MTPRPSDTVAPSPPEPVIVSYSGNYTIREFPVHVARALQRIRKLSGEVRRG